MGAKPQEALKALEPWINKHRRTAWRPEVRSDDQAAALSAFCGIPSLQAGEKWPVCKSCGDPMEALVQLDLSTLPTDRHGTGLLQLFYCVAGECEGGWEAFSNQTCLCRIVSPHETAPAATNLNRFPAKAIHAWTAIEDSPSAAEHERLGIKFDYHFNDVPFHPMEFWCPELDLHFVGAEFIRYLEANVSAADGDKLGGWPPVGPGRGVSCVSRMRRGDVAGHADRLRRQRAVHVRRLRRRSHHAMPEPSQRRGIRLGVWLRE